MIQITEARRISSSRELGLISSSLPPALKAHSVTRLKSKISRARKLREKYQDLYRRQKLRAKSRMTGTPNERLNVRTLRKKQMFGEAVTRLNQQLHKTLKLRTAAGYKRRQAHAAASTRRHQAKRDSRGRKTASRM